MPYSTQVGDGKEVGDVLGHVTGVSLLIRRSASYAERSAAPVISSSPAPARRLDAAGMAAVAFEIRPTSPSAGASGEMGERLAPRSYGAIVTRYVVALKPPAVTSILRRWPGALGTGIDRGPEIV